MTVPDTEKDFYLAHPGEFRETTQELLKVREDAKQIANASLEMLRGVWTSLHLHELQEAAQELQQEIQRRQSDHAQENDVRMKFHAERLKERERKVDVGLESVAIPDPNSEAGLERRAKIKAAIYEMDPKDPEHFTKAGTPRVGAIREAVGFDVTSEEIALATQTEE